MILGSWQFVDINGKDSDLIVVRLVAGRRTWSAVAVATEVRARKISVSTLEWYIRRLATMGQVWVLMCHFGVGAYPHEKGAAGASLSSPSLPADQVPVNTTHSMMLWPKVGCPDHRERLVLSAVRPFQPLHHAACPAYAESAAVPDNVGAWPSSPRPSWRV